MSDTLVRGGWREVSTRRWLASAVALGVDYCLEAGEGVFRRGTAWSLVWDCPHSERLSAGRRRRSSRTGKKPAAR